MDLRCDPSDPFNDSASPLIVPYAVTIWSSLLGGAGGATGCAAGAGVAGAVGVEGIVEVDVSIGTLAGPELADPMNNGTAVDATVGITVDDPVGRIRSVENHPCRVGAYGGIDVDVDGCDACRGEANPPGGMNPGA
jgi:hypothetical protein